MIPRNATPSSSAARRASATRRVRVLDARRAPGPCPSPTRTPTVRPARAAASARGSQHLARVERDLEVHVRRQRGAGARAWPRPPAGTPAGGRGVSSDMTSASRSVATVSPRAPASSWMRAIGAGLVRLDVGPPAEAVRRGVGGHPAGVGARPLQVDVRRWGSPPIRVGVRGAGEETGASFQRRSEGVHEFLVVRGDRAEAHPAQHAVPVDEEGGRAGPAPGSCPCRASAGRGGSGRSRRTPGRTRPPGLGRRPCPWRSPRSRVPRPCAARRATGGRASRAGRARTTSPRG